MTKISSPFIMIIFILTACSPSGQLTATATLSPSQPPTTERKILPTPSIPGNSITWNELQVTMALPEITQDYVTDFGSSRIPTEGNKFLWVHLQLKNAGKIEMDIPLFEHFSILYAGTELKPTYGHRAGYTDYTTLGTNIFPNQKLDGWLRFDIPQSAELNDLRFVFLPKSSQVGASYSSPNYPYSDDKPTYVWKCTP